MNNNKCYTCGATTSYGWTHHGDKQFCCDDHYCEWRAMQVCLGKPRVHNIVDMVTCALIGFVVGIFLGTVVL